MKQTLKIFIFALLVVFSFGAKAQEDKVEVLRKNFILKKVEMTSGESEKFWPVYNEYNDKIRAIRKNLRKNIRQAPDNLTEKEAEELYQLDLKSKQAEVDVHKQYNEKIKAIIGVQKIIKLHKAEEEFKQILVETAKGN
jgi:hypothetical protein